MKLHANARTCPNSRRLLVKRIEEEGWSLAAAAEAAGVSERTAAKWLARWRAEGEAGLLDRSSAPKRVPSAAGRRLAAIEALRRLRMTAAEIAEVLGMALSTVSRWLAGSGSASAAASSLPSRPTAMSESARRADPCRHQEARADQRSGAGHRVTGRSSAVPAQRTGAKRLGATGWEFVHVCVDDATRLAYVEVLPDEKGATAAGFLRRAVEWFEGMGIQSSGCSSDNGACYRSRRPRRGLRASSACATSSPGPTGPAPTARPSASSRR